MLELRARKKIAVPVGHGRFVIETIGQGPLEDGFDVSISKRCGWFGVPRRSFSYHPVKGAPKVKPELEAPVNAHQAGAVFWLPDRGVAAGHGTAQNGMIERVIRTLKEQCVHRRPHQAFGMKTPAQAYASAA